ncbi:MAG: hypothetical protein GX567_11140 [Clostridia bacterium]|nr:hypothetical protein [Clostridia bacterium]
MKKHSFVSFLIKCVLAALPLIVLCLYTTLNPFGYMDQEYPSWHYERTMARSANGYDTLVIGDSTAKAGMIPDVLGEDVINLSMGGATPIEIYYAMEHYLDTHEAPAHVFIMFTPYHYSFLDNFWQRTMYFNYLTTQETLELFQTAKQNKDEEILSPNYQVDALAYRLRLPNKYLPAMINSRLIGRSDSNHEIYAQLIDSRGQSYFGTLDGCSDRNYESNYTALNLSPTVDIYMRRLLDLCTEHQINVIVEQAPMNTTSYEHLDPVYKQEYSDYMKLLKSDYPAITINTEIEHYEDTYYGDASHLNEKGAHKFSGEMCDKYPDVFNQIERGE